MTHGGRVWGPGLRRVGTTLPGSQTVLAVTPSCDTMVAMASVTRTPDETHRSTDELEAGLDHVRCAPREEGVVQLVVARPEPEARAVLAEGRLDLDAGLLGDGWAERGSRSTPDGAADPRAQVTLMNARAADLLAGDRSRWALAGDQFYVDFDIGEENLPAGARIAIGSAVVEVSDKPHTGCKKFAQRFGADALRFVNSPEGRRLRLRGVNARVIEPGVVKVGDPVSKV